jgi:hypothetical protein
MLSFTDSDYIACYEDSGWAWDVRGRGLDESLDEIDGQIRCTALGPNESYIVCSEDCDYWGGLPTRAAQLLKTRSQYDVKWAALGQGGSYFILYDDGAYYWGGDIHRDLQETLDSTDKTIMRVCLCASDDSYFIQFLDGSTEWAAVYSFGNAVKADEHLDPREIQYRNSSIATLFSCGRNIDDVADELSTGQCDVDDIPAIRVVKDRGDIYSLDNRRLYAFKQSGVRKIPVVVNPCHDAIRHKLHGDAWAVRGRCSRSRSRSRDSNSNSYDY